MKGAQTLEQLRAALIPDPAPLFNSGEKELNRFEPAWARAALALRGGPRIGHKSNRRGYSLATVHNVLEEHRRRFEAGDTLQLLQAVRTCAEENVPLPAWLALAFSEAINSFILPTGRMHSLDEVFQSPRMPTTTPKKLAAARQDWQLGCEIWEAVKDELQRDSSLCSLTAVIDEVEKVHKFGVKTTKAKRLLLMVDQSQTDWLNALGKRRQTVSQILEKRRKASAK